MVKTALRNLLAHKMRLAMTVLAIVLGVAFVSGTMVFTTGMNSSLDRFFDNEPADVVVTPTVRLDGGPTSPFTQSPTMSQDVADQVAAVPGVTRAAPVVNQDGAQILDSNGEPSSSPGQLNVGASWDEVDAAKNPDAVIGRGPERDGEVVFDTSTAAKFGFEIGDQVTILTPLAPDIEKKWEVTGIVDLGLPGGATVALFDLATAQKYLVGPGLITSVQADIEEGLTQEEMANRISDALDSDDFTVLTGAESVAAAQAEIAASLGFLNTFLLVFALIAVFVAGFLIFNTFAMLVAQRTKELALLRAIGASRDQVRFTVILESVVLGLVASVVGLGAGVLLARALRGLFGLFGIDLPAGDLSLTPTIVAASFAVGVVITVIAALAPAIRASRVPPVAAMRDDIVPVSRATRERLVGGVLLAMAATGFAGLGLTSENANNGVAWIGLSAVFGIIAVVVLSAFLAKPFISAIGFPFSRTTTGKLAVLNAKRNPRRTAATASALTIGVTLMTIMSIFTTSATATAEQSIDSSIGADFVVTDPTFRPFSTEVYERVSQIPNAESVTFATTSIAQKGNTQTFLFAIEPDKISDMVSLNFVTGSLAALSGGQVAVDEDIAQQYGLNVGDTTKVTFPIGEREVTVGGIFRPVALYSGFLADVPTATLFGLPEGNSAVYVKIAEGADLEETRAQIESALVDFPTLDVQDQTQLKEDFRAQINRLLGFIFVLLGLAVLIAMLGIVNTMQMSVFERTRELGMLRAVGSARGQVRGMIVIEALMLGLFGAVLGVALGSLYGFLVITAMGPLGLEVFGIPWNLLLVFVVAGAVGGVLAAIWPAIRASRLNVLAAIASE